MMHAAHRHGESPRLSRRSVLGLVAASAMLAACSDARGNQATTASTQVPAATTPQAPAAKQTLTGTVTPAASPGASPAAKP